jgi:pyrimidine-nucleoside phosphorylase
MDMREVLQMKRDGGTLTGPAIHSFITGYVAGDVPDYQASALLMAIFIHGMADGELAQWTMAMLNSGERFDFSDIDGPKVDKHSTGGIGDKVSIPLAPAVAVCGAYVPMISGRGLGHTGGTLDKLESIPGFRTALEPDEFRSVLRATGLALGGQTATLVPADRLLYGLRDVTGLIESIPLITSSILSKKLAEGIGSLVLDVKFGSGAFLTDPVNGAALAKAMGTIAKQCGVEATVFQTNMQRPLGRTAGNGIEIVESIDCLTGGGPADLRELVVLQGGEMLRLAGIVDDRATGRSKIERSLDDGSAFERFQKLTELQGGDPAALEGSRGIPISSEVVELPCPATGYFSWDDLRDVGRAVGALGGGRVRMEDEIDPSVGLRFLAAEGEAVSKGDGLVQIYHRGGRGLEEAKALLLRGLRISEERLEVGALVLGV